MQYCLWCTIVAVIGTYCSPAFSNTTHRPSKRSGRADSCLISSVSRTTILKAHHYPLGSLKYPLTRQSMPRMYGPSGLVTMGYFYHSFPGLRLISDSNTVSCWDLPVTPEIQMAYAPAQLDGIRTHCAPVSTKALYSCRADMSAIKSTQSSKPSYPSPPPSWRQGPSNTDHKIPCQLLHKCISFHRVSSITSPSILLRRAHLCM